MSKLADKLHEVEQTVEADWKSAGDLVLPEDSPKADFAEPERDLDPKRLEEQRERDLARQRARRESELDND